LTRPDPAPLRYGAFRTRDAGARVGAAWRDQVLDLAALARRGVLDDVLPDAERILTQPSLNAFMACGPAVWRALHARLRALLDAQEDLPLLAVRDVEPLLPIEIGDFTELYSSREHASNGGRIMRPDGEPLAPNWTHIPVGYHGRSSSVVVSGTDVRRPFGQARDGDVGRPEFRPSRKIDFELELGFVIGVPSERDRPVTHEEALDHVFGVVLLNDWSARDIQAWEARPLGPFLSKAFATSISAWVMPLEDLLHRRVPPADVQDPEPLAYLRGERWAFDIDLQVALRPAGSGEEHVVSETNARYVYWSLEQQIVHLTSGGAMLRTGDLLGSGAISGPSRGSNGSLLELTWNGTEPLQLADGTQRGFLEDGDEVVLRADGLAECRGRVLPARR
jgi:fumarylacetoacetase